MIFKTNPTDLPSIEYRVDVTLRETSLEYDVVIINTGATSPEISIGLSLNLSGAKVVQVKGYKEFTETSAKTPTWSVPIGKFKETAFYAKIVPV
jgi:hypothetical protein